MNIRHTCRGPISYHTYYTYLISNIVNDSTLNIFSIKILEVFRDFPVGPVVKNLPCKKKKKKKNLPCSAGDMGSSPGQGTEIPHAQSNKVCIPQLESLCTTKIRHVAIKTQRSKKNF